jgi:predicted enzyme related to lactoylglutathione lyase
MNDESLPPVGSIGWWDLTVPDAPGVRDFYTAVAGWHAAPLSMGDYDDYIMTTAPGGTPVGGVCHARGDNADLPAQWLMYVVVEDLDASLRRCVEHGGAQVTAVKGSATDGRYCVIRDPAGAVLALTQHPTI